MIEITNIISSIDSVTPSVNPTVIYNEGWMLRLLIQQSIKEKMKLPGLDFKKIGNWTSEALISSPFVKTTERREGYTHADAALGDFKVEYEDRGEIIVSDDAQIFGIIEAKMGSNLSQGTTHAKEYNQAARNIACIAKNTYNVHSCDTFFLVAAPERNLKKHNIQDQLNIAIDQIEKRFEGYNPHLVDMEKIIDQAKKCHIDSISFEDWISKIKDPSAKTELEIFYSKCLKWNRLD